MITNIIMEQIPSQDEKTKPKIYGSKALWQNQDVWFQSTLTKSKYMVPKYFDKIYGSKALWQNIWFQSTLTKYMVQSILKKLLNIIKLRLYYYPRITSRITTDLVCVRNRCILNVPWQWKRCPSPKFHYKTEITNLFM